MAAIRPTLGLQVGVAAVLLVAVLAASAAAARDVPPTNPIRRRCFVDSILAFGDSTTDTGNAVRTGNPLALLAANPPYGIDFSAAPGRGRPSGRFCDGRLMLDFLSEALGLPFVPPHLLLQQEAAALQKKQPAGAVAPAAHSPSAQHHHVAAAAPSPAHAHHALSSAAAAAAPSPSIPQHHHTLSGSSAHAPSPAAAANRQAHHAGASAPAHHHQYTISPAPGRHPAGRPKSVSDNFAVAGATALDASLLKQLANATSLSPFSLTNELQWFHSALHKEGRLALENTLVYFGEIGGNDYNYAFTAIEQQPPAQAAQQTTAVFGRLVPKVINEIRTALRKILDSGVTHVVVQGDFPMGCMPVYLKEARQAAAAAAKAAPPPAAAAPSRHAAAAHGAAAGGLFDAYGCVAAVNAVSDEHNRRLGQVVQELQVAYPHARLVFFDTTAAYLHILHHAPAYGFTNVTDPCVDLGNLLTSPPPPPAAGSNSLPPLPKLVACPNPHNYLSWDGIHMTDAMYKAMVRLFLGLDHRAPVFSFPPRNFLTAPSPCAASKPL